MSYINGIFGIKYDEEVIKNYISVGLPEKYAEDLKDSYWTYSVESLGEDYWLMQTKCDQFPEYNSTTIIQNNVESIINDPMVGEAKVFCTYGDNTLSLTGSNKDLGKFIVDITYTEDSCITHERYTDKNKEHTLVYKRIYPMSGYYKYDHDDGWEAYCLKFGVIESHEQFSELKTFQLSMNVTDKVINFHEEFKDIEAENTLNFDENSEYTFPGAEQFDAKILAKKAGPTSMLWKVVGKTREEEFHLEFEKSRLVWTLIDVESGEKAVLYMKRYVPLIGVFKPIVYVNIEKVMEKLGLPEGTAKAVRDDKDAWMSLSHKNGICSFKSNSVIAKFDASFKMGEEYEVKISDKTMKMVDTILNDNTIKRTVKSDEVNVTSFLKFIEGYLIQTNELEGLDTKSIYVMERIK